MVNQFTPLATTILLESNCVTVFVMVMTKLVRLSCPFAPLRMVSGCENVMLNRASCTTTEALARASLGVKEGEIVQGVIRSLTDYGAFVDIGGVDALLHVADISWGRVNKPSDVVKEGQAVKVKLLGFDDRGKVRLSMKQVDQQTGEDLSKKAKEAAPPAAQ